jgi:uncharacterized membrane protein YukC
MEINWIIVGMLLLGVLILIVFLVRKNQKDKKKYNDFLNKEYKKSADEDADLDGDTY